jgi:hypothetical protein
MSGARKKRNIKEAPNPRAPMQITALNRFFVSIAMIAAIIIKISKM